MFKMFKFAKMYEGAIIPTKGSPGSAGFDLYAATNTVIESGKWGLVKTGIALQIPSDCYARVAPRSGLAFNKGLNVGAGVIDSDYRSEIGVILFNHSKNDFYVNQGDRIAQLIFEKIYICAPEVVQYSELTSTQRDTGGYGSTGV
jgi:deoxyuridine 5'-triphosphate nucleotidohydrolase